MKISIKQALCLHKISEYNNNYYQLPCIIDGCDILLEKWDDYYGFHGNQLGNFVDDKFVCKYYLHQDDNKEYFDIDTGTMHTENHWT